MRRLIQGRFGLELSRSSCLNYLHRLGFVLKRPKNRLVKADPMRRREAFVGEYAALTAAARRTGVKIFFADEAHFRADAELRVQVGVERGAGPGGLQQSQVRREG